MKLQIVIAFCLVTLAPSVAWAITECEYNGGICGTILTTQSCTSLTGGECEECENTSSDCHWIINVCPVEPNVTALGEAGVNVYTFEHHYSDDALCYIAQEVVCVRYYFCEPQNTAYICGPTNPCVPQVMHEYSTWSTTQYSPIDDWSCQK